MRRDLQGKPVGSTHSARLERWLGAEQVELISTQMRDWKGGPIAIRGVPGAVYAARGGDFVGAIEAGGHAGLADFAADRLRQLAARAQRGARRWAHNQQYTAPAGFSSLSDLIAEATAGKKRTLRYVKNGALGVVSASSTLWYVGTEPAAGAAAPAAPGGIAPDNTTVGAFSGLYTPGGADTQHLVRWDAQATVANQTIMLYDRLFSVTKNVTIATAELVTGVPTRYTSTSPSDPDYAGSNFLMPETRTALPATAHSWDDVRYTNQDGNPGAVVPSIAGLASCIQYRLDLTPSTWFVPLATGDHGLTAITQLKQSVALASGAVDWTIGRPLAIFPHLVANTSAVLPLINDAFNLERIYNGACLALLEWPKAATTATVYTGLISSVWG